MKYKPELIERMKTWIEQNGLVEDGGAKLKEFCAYFSITEETYYQWIKKSEFSETIMRARETFRQNLEIEIVQSLARAAKGFSYNEKHSKTIYEDNGKGQPTIRSQQKWEKEIHVAPNVQAGQFLLANLNPNRWKRQDRYDVNLSAQKGLTIICESKEDEEMHKELFER